MDPAESTRPIQKGITMKPTWIGSVVVAALLIAPSSATADTLVPDPPDTSGIRRIGKGIKEIGGESLLVLDYSKAGEASSFRLSTVTGLSFRYFVVDNLNLALNASYFFKGDGTISQQGGVVTLGANYLFNITKGLFFNAGLAAGGFFGKESLKDAPKDAPKPSLSGGAGRLGLGLVFYASPKFALFARPEAVLYFGKTTLGSTSTSLLNVDGGFNVGASFVF
jgi:hypothetical protein